MTLSSKEPNRPWYKGACLSALGLRALRASAIVSLGACLVGMVLSSPDEKPSIGAAVTDPTVGTLPMMGGGSADLDQTITLRGNTGDLRRALVSADGDGFVEVIDVGGGNAWARFYGDVRLELDEEALSNIEVAIFAGFEGNGMRYVVKTASGFGSVQSIMSGFELPVDLVRLSRAGLLEQTTFIYTQHRTGARAMTSVESDPITGNVVFFQDV